MANWIHTETRIGSDPLRGAISKDRARGNGRSNGQDKVKAVTNFRQFEKDCTGTILVRRYTDDYSSHEYQGFHNSTDASPS